MGLMEWRATANEFTTLGEIGPMIYPGTTDLSLRRPAAVRPAASPRIWGGAASPRLWGGDASPRLWGGAGGCCKYPQEHGYKVSYIINIFTRIEVIKN